MLIRKKLLHDFLQWIFLECFPNYIWDSFIFTNLLHQPAEKTNVILFKRLAFLKNLMFKKHIKNIH